ncbi:MAG: glycosyltransferase family 2 protein [Candidatus Limnocylindria bacterium]
MSAELSIFIPVYNDARWLPAAIESVLAQDHAEWELVIGDNASDEPIAELVEGYRDHRIRYRRFERHVGIYENFNRTAALTRHPWIQVLCADDRLRPGCLTRISAAIDAWPSSGSREALAMVLTACRRVDADGRPADRTWYGSKPILDLRPGVYDASSWLSAHVADGWPPWNVGSVAVARSVMEDSGGFFRPEVGLSSDLELSLRAAAYGPVVYIDEPLLDFTVRPDADSSIRLWMNRANGDRRTPVGAALANALNVHETQRTVSAAERKAVAAAIARSHLQRAAQHRVLPGGHGRRAAVGDVLTALRMSPTTVLRPFHAAYGLAAMAAPTSWLRIAQRRLASRHASTTGSDAGATESASTSVSVDGPNGPVSPG